MRTEKEIKDYLKRIKTELEFRMDWLRATGRKWTPQDGEHLTGKYKYAQGLMILCAGHRNRYGIKQPPKRNDCELKPCRTGCPIKIMKEGNRKWMLNRNVAVNQRNTYSQIQEECNLSKSNRAWKGGNGESVEQPESDEPNFMQKQYEIAREQRLEVTQKLRR